MAGTQAPAKRTRKSAPQANAQAVQVEPSDFERIVSYLTTAVLVERAPEMRVLLRGALAGLNIHMIGQPGVAKSLSLREFSKCVEGARYFEKQVHAQMPADALIGAYDMEAFARTGKFARNLDGYLGTAHIGFVDEVPRANGPTLDALLPVMNTQERMIEHNGGMIATDLRMVVTASNTWFDAENTQAQALSDRISVMMLVEDLKSDESFKDLMRRDHDRRVGALTGTAVPRETITLEQFDQAQREVKQIRLTPEFLEKLSELRRASRNEALLVSPRRWVELVMLCRANAWMARRDHVIPEDLAIVEHGLWRDKDDRPKAHELVLPFHGRFEREAAKFRQEAAKPLANVEAIAPEVEGTPPNEELDQDVLTKAISASRAIDAVKDRVDKTLVEAQGEGRDAAALAELANELLTKQRWFKQHGLPSNYSGD